MVDLTMLFPIIMACLIIFIFTRFPKTGIVLSVLLCFISRDIAGMIGNQTDGFMAIHIMEILRSAAIVGMVACVIQIRINKLSEKSEKKKIKKENEKQEGEQKHE